MTINKPKLCLSESHWRPALLWQRIGLTPFEKETVFEQGSLTAKFRSHCPGLTVTVLSEKWEVPLGYERQSLNLALGQRVWIRCVVLKCGETPLLYARTLIPSLQPGNPWFALKQLGTQPLGEVLFQLKQLNKLKRSPFKVLKTVFDWPYLDPSLSCNPFAARVSVFEQQQAKLLLTEVFLT